jgi:hypothetical protein
MGLEPDRVTHIHEASRFLGNSSPALIDQLGEVLRRPQAPFKVVPEFEHIRSFRHPSSAFRSRASGAFTQSM